MTDFSALEQRLQQLIGALDTAQLKHLARQLRQRNQQRQRKQQNPDGSAWAPRKDRRIRQKMMQGLIKARHFTIRQQAAGVSLGYHGRTAQIARIHHYGLRDRPGPDTSPVVYASRQLLGVTAADYAWMEDQVLRLLAPK